MARKTVKAKGGGVATIGPFVMSERLAKLLHRAGVQSAAEIRKAMSAALHRKDIAEYHRLGAEHRAVVRGAK